MRATPAACAAAFAATVFCALPARAVGFPPGGFELNLSPSIGLSPGHLTMLAFRPGGSVFADAGYGPFSLAAYTAVRAMVAVPHDEATGTRNLESVGETELFVLAGPGLRLRADDGEVHSLHLLLGVSVLWGDNRVVNPDYALDARHRWRDTAFEPALLYSSYNPLGKTWGWTFRFQIPLRGWLYDAPINMFLEAGLSWQLL